MAWGVGMPRVPSSPQEQTWGDIKRNAPPSPMRHWEQVHEGYELVPGERYRGRFTFKAPYPGTEKQKLIRAAIMAGDKLYPSITVHKVEFREPDNNYAIGRWAPWQLQVEFSKGVKDGTIVLAIIAICSAALGIALIATLGSRQFERLIDAGDQAVGNLFENLKETVFSPAVLIIVLVAILLIAGARAKA